MISVWTDSLAYLLAGRLNSRHKMSLTVGEVKLRNFRAREKPQAVTCRINLGIPRSMRF
jgi:hypothetical protein